MSAFYGCVSGMAETSATRRGSKTSGIRSSAQSFDGSVITRLDYREVDGQEILTIDIDLADDSTSCGGKDYFYGTLEELKECFSLYSAMKNDEYDLKHNEDLQEDI